MRQSMLVLLDRSEWIEEFIGARTFLSAHFIGGLENPRSFDEPIH